MLCIVMLPAPQMAGSGFQHLKIMETLKAAKLHHYVINSSIENIIQHEVLQGDDFCRYPVCSA
jgi:hypothetical protein